MPGTVLMFRQEEEGQPIKMLEIVFESADETSATMLQRTRDETGQVIDEQSATSSWEELRQHASFPAELTQIRDDTVETPAGEFEAQRYTVSDAQGVTRHWFAAAHPGPPVLTEREVDGTVVFRSSLLARKTPQTKKGKKKARR